MRWLTAASVLGLASAVYRADIGLTDWVIATVGIPRFVAQSNQTLLVLTEEEVLGAIDERGATIWRRPLEKHQALNGLALAAVSSDDTEEDIAIVGGDFVSAYNVTDGNLLWTADLPGSVWTSNGELTIAGTHTVTGSGQLTPLDAKVSGAAVPVKSGVALSWGQLTWNELGVLELNDKEGTLLWSRDEGLAHIKDAVFLQSGDYQNAERKLLDEEFGSVNGTAGGKSIIGAWRSRIASRPSELWDFVVYLMKNIHGMLILPEIPKPQFGLDQLLIAATQAGSVYAVNTTIDSGVVWVYHDLNPTTLRLTEDRTYALVESLDGVTYILNFEGDIAVFDEEPSFYPTDRVKFSSSGAPVAEGPGWKLDLPGNEIVGVASRARDEVTANIAVPLNEADVLYKYLNPFTVAVATYEAEGEQLAITVIDAVSGRILAQGVHSEKVVINDENPFNIAFGEHWVVYTYLSRDASESHKVTVWEFYESNVSNKRLSRAENSGTEEDWTPFVRQHTWLMPSDGEPVHAIGLSKTRFGAASRDIIFSLQHQIVALPKNMLSALNPLPEIHVLQQSHLSHIFGVAHAGRIVTGPTNLESTYLVAALDGPDVFYAQVRPSGEIDVLHHQFPKIKLIVCVVAAYFLMFTLSPLARMKQLKSQWR